jgi:hypothetical protein
MNLAEITTIPPTIYGPSRVVKDSLETKGFHPTFQRKQLLCINQGFIPHNVVIPNVNCSLITWIPH